MEDKSIQKITYYVSVFAFFVAMFFSIIHFALQWSGSFEITTFTDRIIFIVLGIGYYLSIYRDYFIPIIFIVSFFRLIKSNDENVKLDLIIIWINLILILVSILLSGSYISQLIS